MIRQLNGTILEWDRGGAIIDCGGVGYGVRWTPYTARELDADVGATRCVRIHHAISEHAHTLYAFSHPSLDPYNEEPDELVLFKRLIRVRRVGPGTAMTILSSVASPYVFEELACTGDVESLVKALDGVGPAMARAIREAFVRRGVVRGVA